MVLKAFATKHTVPSLGYIVSERRKKLKAEYLELSGEQIRDLRESGTEITTERRLPLVGFTGDTSPEGLDNNPEFYETKILITEMTFVSPEHRPEFIHKNGHMHLDDFVARQDKFNNEIVIAGHFSTRYNLQQAKKIVARQLPGMLGGRLKLWV